MENLDKKMKFCMVSLIVIDLRNDWFVLASVYRRLWDVYPGRSFLAHDPAGERGKIWNMEAVFPPGIFPMISGWILLESIGICQNSPKKIRKIPGRNNASNFLVFSVASRPYVVHLGTIFQTPFSWAMGIGKCLNILSFYLYLYIRNYHVVVYAQSP
jgi:hypothetical protein